MNAVTINIVVNGEPVGDSAEPAEPADAIAADHIKEENPDLFDEEGNFRWGFHPAERGEPVMAPDAIETDAPEAPFLPGLGLDEEKIQLNAGMAVVVKEDEDGITLKLAPASRQASATT